MTDFLTELSLVAWLASLVMWTISLREWARVLRALRALQKQIKLNPSSWRQ